MEDAGRDLPARSSLPSVIRKGALIFVALLAILALVAWLAGDALLPMEYEGFD